MLTTMASASVLGCDASGVILQSDKVGTRRVKMLESNQVAPWPDYSSRVPSPNGHSMTASLVVKRCCQ